MKLVEKIDKYIKDKTRCFVNGMPDDDETKGTILKKEEDYIEFETLKIEEEKKSQKEKTTREVFFIPIANIDCISEGQKESEVNMLDKAMTALDA